MALCGHGSLPAPELGFIRLVQSGGGHGQAASRVRFISMTKYNRPQGATVILAAQAAARVCHVQPANLSVRHLDLKGEGAAFGDEVRPQSNVTVNLCSLATGERAVSTHSHLEGLVTVFTSMLIKILLKINIGQKKPLQEPCYSCCVV